MSPTLPRRARLAGNALGPSAVVTVYPDRRGWIAHVKQADTLGLREFMLQRFALEGRSLAR